jgi:hypothetical protein
MAQSSPLGSRNVPVREADRVLAYLLRAPLAHVHLLADTANTRNLAAGEVGSEQLGRLIPVTVERCWRLVCGRIRRECSGRPLAGHGDRGLGGRFAPRMSAPKRIVSLRSASPRLAPRRSV